MKDAVIRARCSTELKERVAQAAARLGLEEADIVRMAVVDYLNRHDTEGPTATLTIQGPISSAHAATKSAPARIVDMALRAEVDAAHRRQRKSKSGS